MDTLAHGSDRMARLATTTGLVVTVLGIAVLITGTALFDAQMLAFPFGVQVAIVVGGGALGLLPCRLLLRAVRLARPQTLTQSRTMSIGGGIMLLPGIAAAALFKVFANPCWDNPSCTGGMSLADTLLGYGIVILVVAVAVTLLVVPGFITVIERSAHRASRV